MEKYIVIALLTILWVYLLRVLDRAKLNFWLFMVGSAGLFILMMLLVRPIMTEPLAKAVAAIAGVFGNLTGWFTPYFKYGILFVNAASGPMTLQINFECSGIIEIMAYLSLLSFFRVYTRSERAAVAVIGILGIIMSNVVRIIVICSMIYFGGSDLYYLAHTIVGRLVFYALTVVLYFYVFTKPHIVRMKVGKFSYGDSTK